MMFFLGCSNHAEGTKVVFDKSSFKADNQGKVKISGVLENGERGNLKANINTQNITLKVEKNGKFKVYYDLKNIQDDKIYLGIESNGIIVGNEAKIKITKKLRDDYLLSATDIIRRYNYEGYTVLNSKEISTQDLNSLGLNSEKIDSITSEEFNIMTGSMSLASVRVFTFNSSKKLDFAYNYLISNSRISPNHYNLFSNNDAKVSKNPLNNVAPRVLERYESYVQKIDEMPLLNSWIYKAYVDDSGYILVQQDSTINSSIAASHEKIINDLLNENRINDNDLE